MQPYYQVTGACAPNYQEITIGYYADRRTADRVAEYVRTVHIPIINGGIDVHVKNWEGEITITDAGMRLKEMPMGRIIMIQNELDSKEYERLKDFKFYSNS